MSYKIKSWHKHFKIEGIRVAVDMGRVMLGDNSEIPYPKKFGISSFLILLSHISRDVASFKVMWEVADFSKFANENWREDMKGALRVVTVGSCPKRGSKLFAHKS